MNERKAEQVGKVGLSPSFSVRVRDEGGNYIFQASLEFEARWLAE
jgi:hypothetical protein